MNTQELTVQDRVRDYVEAVRTALGDLSPDVVDDLTEGLEADLADQVADSPSGLGGLPSPTGYAAELRSAAGLPEGAVSPSPGPWWERDVWTPTLTAWTRAREENALLARGTALADELRPVGWVLRGVVVALLVVGLLDVSYPWLLSAVFAAVSVWAGRRRHRSGRWGRVVLAQVSALAVIGAIPASWVAADLVHSPTAVSISDQVGNGMYFQGRPITNLYLYDAEGKRLTDVRAFDQEGRPVNLSTQYLQPDGSALPPLIDRYGTAWANGLPVRDDSTIDPWAVVSGQGQSWRAPTVLPPLGAAIPTPTPASSATPTTTPTTSAPSTTK